MPEDERQPFHMAHDERPDSRVLQIIPVGSFSCRGSRGYVGRGSIHVESRSSASRKQW